MKIITPTRLAQVVRGVCTQHPLPGQLQTDLPTNSLHELVGRIQKTPPEELEDFAALLTRRQRQNLCRYLATNSFHVDLDKISAVIWPGMEPACFSILFQVWQNYPGCTHAISLLGRYDMPPYRPEEFPVAQGLLHFWGTSSNPVDAVVTSLRNTEISRPLSERFAALGLKTSSSLALHAMRRFFCQAQPEEFRTEGDKSLCWLLLQPASKGDQANIILRLLACAEQMPELLTLFNRTYTIASGLWGPADGGSFPSDWPRLRLMYRWWQNYHQLSSALTGDKDRISYWQRYLHRCTCIRSAKHKLLILRFSDYVVTEFEDVGPVYLFSSGYYDEQVMPHVPQCSNSSLRSWLFNESQYLAREVHSGNWQWKLTRVLKKYRIVS